MVPNPPQVLGLAALAEMPEDPKFLRKSPAIVVSGTPSEVALEMKDFFRRHKLWSLLNHTPTAPELSLPAIILNKGPQETIVEKAMAAISLERIAPIDWVDDEVPILEALHWVNEMVYKEFGRKNRIRAHYPYRDLSLDSWTRLNLHPSTEGDPTLGGFIRHPSGLMEIAQPQRSWPRLVPIIDMDNGAGFEPGDLPAECGNFSTL
jgi:hypothetical protein